MDGINYFAFLILPTGIFLLVTSIIFGINLILNYGKTKNDKLTLIDRIFIFALIIFLLTLLLYTIVESNFDKEDNIGVLSPYATEIV
ncbi:hypothetical protein EMA8858_04176 [Emticicia aquatica]|uniref:Uncharacterized protein n=1 Tax=Emticicia aquatica TaxID=1681835 RepID=A0ABM9AVH0_9BACT|nr:hypothetical protein EMA8858_04176 [Emticicia aquatica]